MLLKLDLTNMLSISDVVLRGFGIVIVLITPGPTNILLAASGSTQGVKRSMPLIGSELLGYVLSISFWGYLIASTSQTMHWFSASVRLVSSGYILYLAMRMWHTAIALTSSKQSAIRLHTLL